MDVDKKKTRSNHNVVEQNKEREDSLSTHKLTKEKKAKREVFYCAEQGR